MGPSALPARIFLTALPLGDCSMACLYASCWVPLSSCSKAFLLTETNFPHCFLDISLCLFSSLFSLQFFRDFPNPQLCPFEQESFRSSVTLAHASPASKNLVCVSRFVYPAHPNDCKATPMRILHPIWSSQK